MLDKETFLTIIANTPLVSIDLIVRSPQDGILMGKRTNEPAKGFWFVPGGRIFKLETLEQAFSRISETELGNAYRIQDAKLLGAFTHLYDENFAHEPGISTHYVVLAYELRPDLALENLPRQQHASYRWFSADEELGTVHPNSQAYFPYLK